MSYYRQHVFFCCNQRDGGRPCCNDKGATELRDYCKQRVKKLGLAGTGRVRVNMAGCLDRCEEGPVIVVYPEEVWYRYENRAGEGDGMGALGSDQRLRRRRATRQAGNQPFGQRTEHGQVVERLRI